MIIHNWSEIEYSKGYEMMQTVHNIALKDKKNHLILCSHPNVFTVGYDEKENFNVDTVKCDRGGSITCHSPGQNIYYFCFQVKNPAFFYKRVIDSFDKFFNKYLPNVIFDKKRPGFYIENRKIASLGFRYSQGVSLHGVALNVDVDLPFHLQVNPCNLIGIEPTSLRNEGLFLGQDEVNKEMINFIKESFS